MNVKNLSQLKKFLNVGMQYEIVENAIKPQNEGIVRTIEVIHSNCICASGVWLMYQKARNMRFNNDNTIDFLISEEITDQWLTKQQQIENKDYWLKIKLI